MKHFLRMLLIAGASFYLGWSAKAYFSQVDDLRQLTAAKTSVPEAPTVTREVPPSPVQAEDAVSYSQQFRQLLASQAFDEAMLLFEQAEETDDRQLRSLHADLLAYLQTALARGQDEKLMALVDAYLSRYYDDIDVLMIMAEYQRRQGYPDEAARVVQFAFTYAYQAAQREKVSTFFQSLVEKTDAAFSQQQQWVELLGFYQLLESIDLSQPRYQIRQAMAYLELRDYSSARELLRPLTENVKWAIKANELLAIAESQAGDLPEQVAAVDGIPLRRLGDHYLITARLNAVAEVTLMIDTGASVTSLSKSSFDALSRHSNFINLGSRLFNTANGVTTGTVYRADQLSLGDHVLQDVELAVLDYQQGPGVDGLLGMNVLQYFRFEIDQDQQVLYLQERR